MAEVAPPTDVTVDGVDPNVPNIASPTLRPGDCFLTPEALAASENPVPCSERHSYEVFSFTEVAETEFPGSEALDSQAAMVCEESFRNITGTPSAMSLMETIWAVPTADTWESGDRYIACVARYPVETSLTFGEVDPLRAFGLVSVFGLQTGDCFEDINLERIGARATSCDNPHTFEVYATTQLADGNFPGDAAISEEQNRFCGAELETFLGGNSSAGNPQALFPDQQTWTELNDRQISCLLRTDTAIVGSLRATGGGDGTAAAAAIAPNQSPTDLFGGDLSVGNFITIDAMSAEQISLKWDGVADATSYELTRVLEGSGEGQDPRTWPGAQTVYTGPDSAFIDESVEADQSYVYVITASGADFTTNPQWRIAAAVADTTAPTPVGSISAIRVGDGVALQWGETSENYRFAVYEVFRGVDGAEPEYLDSTWTQDATAYVDRTTPDTGEVTYQVVAIDFHGNRSEPSSLTYSLG